MSTTAEILRRHRNLTVPHNIRVPEDMDASFVKLAKRLKLSRSEAGREALAEWIEKRTKPTA